MKSEKQFDAVRLMREVRERLNQELAGKSFEQQKQYIQEHVTLPEPSKRTHAA